MRRRGRSRKHSAKRGPERCAHGIHGAGRANEHCAYCDGLNDIEPYRIRRYRRIVGADPARQIRVEEQQQRDHDPPRDDAARDVDGSKLRADDVPDSDEGGRKAGRGPRNAAEMRDVADGLLFEIEMLDYGTRESQKTFGVFMENLRAFSSVRISIKP